jgi:hypothetical protein
MLYVVIWYICATDALVSCARNKINKFAYDGRWTFEEVAPKFCIISDKNSLRLSATKSRFNIHKGAQAFFGVVPFNIV